MPLDDLKLDPGVPIIRTSDRGQFRSCRRLWNWRSALREGLEVAGPEASPLWLGSGVHYALEDFHGYNCFQDPRAAFAGYVDACRRTANFELPSNWREDADLALDMLEYYLKWLDRPRDPLDTYWLDGVPQVEVDIVVEIPLDPPIHGHDRVYYAGTLDRVVIDKHQRLWIVEYKTAARYEQFHFQTDSQVTAYCWLVWAYYQQPAAGVVYQQHIKTTPHPPEILKSTGMPSANKSQNTTHLLYREALINQFGSIDKVPSSLVDTLNHFAMQEDDNYDKFIRRDKIIRNEAQIFAEGQKVLLELEEILDPDLPIYPSPGRMICGGCNFESPCVSLDSNLDWEYELKLLTRPRREDYNPWRKHLRLPSPHQDLNLEEALMQSQQ